MSFKCDIITPQGSVFSQLIDAIKAPGMNGFFQILQNHQALVYALRTGVITIEYDGQKKYFAIDSGICEVNQHHECMVLADQCVECSNLESAKQYQFT